MCQAILGLVVDYYLGLGGTIKCSLGSQPLCITATAGPFRRGGPEFLGGLLALLLYRVLHGEFNIARVFIQDVGYGIRYIVNADLHR